LKKYRPDLIVHTIAAQPTGLGIVQNLDPGSRLLESRMREIVDEFLAIDLSVLDGRKQEMLGRYPNDWAAISRLIDSKGRL
jgi:hypothetical protein